MDITVTITIPESIAESIEQQENGKSVDKVIQELVEEKYASPTKISETESKLTIADLSGMFSSKEIVDSAARHSEILNAEMGRSSLGRE